MDDRDDPISTFFPGADSVDLYEVLSLTPSTKVDEIKKAYRRLALVYHPDKHAAASDQAKTDASLKFQQIGFAYAVLSDDKRRQRYDLTGKTDEGFELGPGEDGWQTYFEQLFESVTRARLDELKKEYQGSQEEIDDLKKAYTDAEGAIGEIMNRIPHSIHDDEARFIIAISELIRKGELESLSRWESSVQDEKARLVRKKQGQKEAQEAESLAKELGVWDEFYGSGKPGARKAKGKEKQDGGDEDEEDHSALQALMLKRKKKMDGFFDSLASKYAEPESSTKAKGKKRANADEDQDAAEEEPPKKKSRKDTAVPPDIDDEEFAKLQEKLFGNKGKTQGSTSVQGKGKRKSGTGRKAR